jgi:hypothetical protein
MRTPTAPHLVSDVSHVVAEAEVLAVKTAHLVAHAADHAVDVALSPLSVRITIDDVAIDDLDNWD